MQQLVVEAVGEREAAREREQHYHEAAAELAKMLDELRRLVVPEAPGEPHRLCDLLLFAFHACRRLDGRLLELRRAPLR